MLSVVLAVLAAAANAAASVAQRRATRNGADQRGSVGIRALWGLVHQPVWVAGVAAIIIGFLIQAAALATGPIALVQPVLVVELPFTLLLGGLVFHSRLHRREWTAIAGMSVGLALLLFGLAPTGGDARHASDIRWVIGSGAVIAVVVALVVVGLRSTNARRAAFLGVATGVLFGYTAALVAGVAAVFTGGAGDVLHTWLTYALMVAGPVGFLLLQNALRAGRLVASQPALTLSNPLVAVCWGVAVFDEQVRLGAWVAAELIGAALIAAGTVVLARSPLLHGRRGGSETPSDTGTGTGARPRT